MFPGLIGLAIFVGVDGEGVAVDILIEPGLGGEDIVEEDTIDQQPAIDDAFGCAARLIFGNIGLGEVETIEVGPDFHLFAIDVLEIIVIGQVPLFDSVD